MPTDIEIAQAAKLRPITDIAREAGIREEELELYGRYKAKVSSAVYERLKGNHDGKLIFVTAITATSAGEGKTCTSVGLAQSLGRIGKKVFLCLREPSLGPVFGIKGGAAGGGYAQVLPMEEINLHFTGDFYAIAEAHNLLAALIDNHIVSGNALDIDVTKVFWRRVIDMNDRQLRHVVTGLGGKVDGVPRETGFDITAASEIMAVLCLATSLADLKERLGRMMVAYTRDGRPVFARDLKAVGAMAMLLKDALQPNLVQTVEGQPAFIHGGPFANIAHGNNSVIATRTALKLADYVVTEGGFAADLGAEKFFDIVAPATGMKPSVAVLVASARALKMHGGVAKEQLNEPNAAALGVGFSNLDQHIANLKKYGLPIVVAINRFPTDDAEELALIRRHCEEMGVEAAVSEVVAKGGEGGVELAQKVAAAADSGKAEFRSLYDPTRPIKEKVETLATRLYGADGVQYTPEAEKDIDNLTKQGFAGLPICVAKTQFSLSDDPKRLGAPKGWKLTVREVKVSAGAGFLVCLTGDIRTMPGLPKHPAAENMDIDENGRITGLF